MKKLSLKLDELAVETFATVAEGREPRGTVRGHVDTDSCPGYSCAVTCGIVISGTTAARANTAHCGNTFQYCCV